MVRWGSLRMLDKLDRGRGEELTEELCGDLVDVADCCVEELTCVLCH
jgi:hypothetical protein